MARFRVWLRGYVRNLLYSNDRQTRKQKEGDGKPYTSAKELKISAPVLVNHNGVDFVPNNTLPRSLSVQNIREPHPERNVKHQSMDIEVPQSIAMVIEDWQPSPVPALDVEETAAAPSLIEDINDGSDSAIATEDSEPPTPPHQRIFKRYSFIKGLSTSPDHVQASMSRPHSYVDSSSSEMSDTNRMSFYSVMSRTVSKKGKRMSVTSGPGGRRASVMSDGREWEERRLSSISNRMSWGFETYQTHASMYAPVRI